MTNKQNLLPDPWLENQLARLVRAASEREVGPGIQKIQDDLLAYVYAHRDPRFIPGPPLCEMCAPSGECHTGMCPGGAYLAQSPSEPQAPQPVPCSCTTYCMHSGYPDAPIKRGVFCKEARSRQNREVKP